MVVEVFGWWLWCLEMVVWVFENGGCGVWKWWFGCLKMVVEVFGNGG